MVSVVGLYHVVAGFSLLVYGSHTRVARHQSRDAFSISSAITGAGEKSLTEFEVAFILKNAASGKTGICFHLIDSC